MTAILPVFVISSIVDRRVQNLKQACISGKPPICGYPEGVVLKKCFSFALSITSLSVLVGGCGGSTAPLGGGSAGGNLGGISYDVVGAAQAPVQSSGYGSIVVGLAGATFSSITQSYASTNIANTKIAFQSLRDGNYNIFTMFPDGSGLSRLTTTTSNETLPCFSPDGSYITFQTDRDGNTEIYVMKSDGSSQVNVSNNSFADSYPSWSPGGTKIAFASVRDGNLEIYSMNTNGTGVTRLTNNAATDFSPSWSPDGNKILFQSFRDGNYELYVMNADGTSPIRLTNNVAADGNAKWSPDGSKILFYSERDHATGEIYSMNSDGFDVTRLTNNTAADYYPDFSPDGSKIVFTTFRDANYEVYTMNADGSAPQRITNSLPSDYVPAWSPYLKPKYIGTSGQLGTACAGFLYGKNGAINTSILVFDTPTVALRANARIAAVTGADSNSPNLSFTLNSNSSISTLKFINMGANEPPVTLNVPTGTTDALVLFETSTGLVTDVVPYSANRSAATSTTIGDLTTMNGAFTAIFDSKGKNIAPRGASTITYNKSTGMLVNFQ